MALKTPPPTDEYRKGWDAIFGTSRRAGMSHQPVVPGFLYMPDEPTPEEEEYFKELEKKNERASS